MAVVVSLGLRLLQEGGCSTWAELVGDDPQYREKAMKKVTLSPVQAALLDRNTDALTWIAKIPKPEGGTATSTIAICSMCSGFTILTGAAPSSCKLTKQCRDAVEAAADAEEKKALKPVKIKAATRQKTPEDPLNEPADVEPVTVTVETPAVVPSPAVTVPAPSTGRAEAEVSSDGLVRAKAVVFGDDIADEFFNDDPTPTGVPSVPVVESAPEPLPAPTVDALAPPPLDTFDIPVNPADVTEDF
ncbi:hypothetical protein [Aeromicrobium sp. 179-A 4D2 NHS]|uniref:hypothetical protein n=1 Tax=Aeromicrobium sp. 179-A 4D2 NHS TaxID=3142375 RepID=UPI0039A140F3